MGQAIAGLEQVAGWGETKVRMLRWRHRIIHPARLAANSSSARSQLIQ